MDINKYKKLVTETVVEPMLSFVEEWDDCEHTREDVEKCGELIVNYLEALADLENPADDAIMEQVKKLVLDLNDLNESVDFSLIETGEREAIWEIIQTSAIECGLREYSEDITEEWREW